MSKKEELKSVIHSVPNAVKYLQEHASPEIFIAEMDKDSTAYILYDIDKTKKICKIAGVEMVLNKEKTFLIINSSNIVFIPIDGKNGLLGGVSNCDFVFFNDQNFCFVEMKLNAVLATSQTLLQQERAIRRNRKKAVEQLKCTINYFDTEFSKDYKGLKLEAYIATPDIYPRENTAFQSIKIQFLKEVHIKLFEGREKKYN
ncbi:MAG: hypothetical protein FWC34_02825 [Bacteroidetes bacterium]|nr:hypothetical protein [Bacteroidota bacterium]MCL2302648.1 hypothetical protein [Lentimicrobiaceae bacterium]